MHPFWLLGLFTTFQPRFSSGVFPLISVARYPNSWFDASLDDTVDVHRVRRRISGISIVRLTVGVGANTL